VKLVEGENFYPKESKLVKTKNGVMVAIPYTFYDKTSRKHRVDEMYFPIDISEVIEDLVGLCEDNEVMAKAIKNYFNNLEGGEDE